MIYCIQSCGFWKKIIICYHDLLQYWISLRNFRLKKISIFLYMLSRIFKMNTYLLYLLQICMLYLLRLQKLKT